ncbi:MAG: beta-lactamase family protein, partial [Actinomycetia bacterium]|nr:beta-lactamase family protein [Actinomycetes bacterium]
MTKTPSINRLTRLCDDAADKTGFSGVVRVDLADTTTTELAYGLADRRWNAPLTVDTRLSIASATKGFTALAAMALIEAGQLSLNTTARSLLGPDLPLIDDAVTVEHLLAHRSGIGDYLDESTLGEISDHVMPVPVHQLDSTESYLAILGGHEQTSPPGQKFAYNNGGFVVLALLVERAGAKAFEYLIDELVCRPAGLDATAFIRSDSLPPGVATGYLADSGHLTNALLTNALLTNALHLPVMGSGDGGLFSTTADMRRFWVALFEGRIVSTETVEVMTRPRSTTDSGSMRYGLGFWLAGQGPMVSLEGYDAGVSFGSWHDPSSGQTY